MTCDKWSLAKERLHALGGAGNDGERGRGFVLELSCIGFDWSVSLLCRQLIHSLLPFLRGLSQLPDVRPTLAECFNMPEYFSKHGYCLYEDASGYLTAAAAIIS